MAPTVEVPFLRTTDCGFPKQNPVVAAICIATFEGSPYDVPQYHRPRGSLLLPSTKCPFAAMKIGALNELLNRSNASNPNSYPL